PAGIAMPGWYTWFSVASAAALAENAASTVHGVAVGPYSMTRPSGGPELGATWENSAPVRMSASPRGIW
ncbi:MAG TPA: hypothetical protein VF940_06340, partial [Streptosporangiaceae bacterium]